MALYDDSVISPTPGIGTTTAELCKLIERNVMIALRVGMPATVLVWRPPVAAGPMSKPAMVDVQPHFIEVIGMNSVDELTPELAAVGWIPTMERGTWVRKRQLPMIRNRPVHYPGPAGMYCRGPLKPGETGWLKFADRSLDKWIQLGIPVDPTFMQYHDLTDAVFEPGLRAGATSLLVDSAKFTIGSEDDAAGFDIDDATRDITLRTTGPNATVEALTQISLGIGAALGVARQTDSVAPTGDMTNFMAAVTTALTTIAAAVPVVIVPPIPPATIGTISTASTKVKAE
jgi:hypothetical protein